jgi:hypothetical protein
MIKIRSLGRKFVLNFYFGIHYFSLLNKFMRKEKDQDPYL